MKGQRPLGCRVDFWFHGSVQLLTWANGVERDKGREGGCLFINFAAKRIYGSAQVDMEHNEEDIGSEKAMLQLIG